MKFIFISSIFSSSVFCSTNPKLLAKLQPYVVSIKSRSIVAAYGDVSPSAGTGFIVDVKNGYIFSNAHVAAGNKVIPEYLATLSSGKEIVIKLIYSDPAADIAVFQGSPNEIDLKNDLPLSSDPVRVGTNVLIIGKNENRHFSTQTGIVANPNEIEGHLPQHAMRISLNMQGGGSGSMVYDVSSGKVIGVIFASNMATSAFALPITYGVDILRALKAGEEPKRFGLGAILGYCSLDDLIKYYNLPKNMAVVFDHDNYKEFCVIYLASQDIFEPTPQDQVNAMLKAEAIIAQVGLDGFLRKLEDALQPPSESDKYLAPEQGDPAPAKASSGELKLIREHFLKMPVPVQEVAADWCYEQLKTPQQLEAFLISQGADKFGAEDLEIFLGITRHLAVSQAP
ncbi:MAG: serine protease, partial [Sphingobacteriia bacterium]|nr:serine protease [Sphingobacteriia bacterium]